jgi:hypothetical protein
VNRTCFFPLLLAAHPPIPGTCHFPLCVGCMRDGTMFSLVCALSFPASAEGCPSLFGCFTGMTAQPDFSSTCMRAVRFMAFADRPRSRDQGVLEISRLSCMLFLSVRGFLVLCRTEQPLATMVVVVLPSSTRNGVGVLYPTPSFKCRAPTNFGSTKCSFSLLSGPHQRLPCASSHQLQPLLRLSSRPS